MKIICCSGVGATGKTTLISNMKEAYPDKFELMTSPTREFYKKKGITNETHSLNQEGGKLAGFQYELSSFYMDKLRKIIGEAAKSKIILCDRSFIDYLCYTELVVSLLDGKYKDKFRLLYDEFLDFEIDHIYCPIITKWRDDPTDNIRDNNLEKDYILSGLIIGELGKYHSHNYCAYLNLSIFNVEEREDTSFITNKIKNWIDRRDKK